MPRRILENGLIVHELCCDREDDVNTIINIASEIWFAQNNLVIMKYTFYADKTIINFSDPKTGDSYFVDIVSPRVWAKVCKELTLKKINYAII